MKLDFSTLPFENGSAELIMGREINEQPISLSEVTQDSGRICVWGDIFSVESRENWDKTKLITSIYFTDYTGSNILKVIADTAKEEMLETVSKLKKGCTILVKGEVQYDKYLKDITIKPRDIMMVKKKRKPIMPRKNEWNCIYIPTCRLWMG